MILFVTPSRRGKHRGGFCQRGPAGPGRAPRQLQPTGPSPLCQVPGRHRCLPLPPRPRPLAAGLPQESRGTPTSLPPPATGPGDALHAGRGAGRGFNPRGKRPGSPLAEGPLASLLLRDACWGQPGLRPAALQPRWERSPADGCSSE